MREFLKTYTVFKPYRLLHEPASFPSPDMFDKLVYILAFQLSHFRMSRSIF